MSTRRWWMVVVLAVSCFAVAACGSDSSTQSSSSSSTAAGGAAEASQLGAANPTGIKPGKRGGTATFLSAADVDYLDPGQTYATCGSRLHCAVTRPLYSLEPNDPAPPVADLAPGPPQISQDNKTLTV